MRTKTLVVMECLQHKDEVVVKRRRPIFKGPVLAAEGWCKLCKDWHEMDLFTEEENDGDE